MASDEDLVEIRIPPPPGGIEIPGIEGMCYPDSAGPMYPRREINWTSVTGGWPPIPRPMAADPPAETMARAENVIRRYRGNVIRLDDFVAGETDPVVGGTDGP